MKSAVGIDDGTKVTIKSQIGGAFGERMLEFVVGIRGRFPSAGLGVGMDVNGVKFDQPSAMEEKESIGEKTSLEGYAAPGGSPRH